MFLTVRDFRKRWLCPVGGLVFMLLAAHAAWGTPCPSQVLVLYNQASDDGRAIAEYYQQLYPEVRLAGLTDVPLAEQVSSQVYFNTIRPQVLDAVTDDTQVIVTTRDLPLRIYNSSKQTPTWNYYSSLESELTRIDSIGNSKLMGNQSFFLPDIFGGNSLAANPYFKSGETFDANQYGMYLTSRLDGLNVDDVKASLDRAQNAYMGRGNCFVLDDDPNAQGAAADLMENLAGNVLPAHGAAYEYDATDTFLIETIQPGCVLGYMSHGTHGGGNSQYMGNNAGSIKFDLADGAVFHTMESYNARTFDTDGNSFGHGTIGQWLALGGTAGVGHVEEPGVSVTSVTNGDVMFDRLLSGDCFAEAAWQATAQLSFVNTVVGDPLMTFKPWTVGDADMDGEVTWADFEILMADWQGPENRPWTGGDMNGDGLVDMADIDLFSENFEPDNSGQYVAGDVNGDGVAGLADLEVLGTFFGLKSGGRRWLGDITGDGCINLLDLNAFGNAIASNASQLTGDANGDGVVDLVDLDIFGLYYNTQSDYGLTPGDFNQDGRVSLTDLDILGRNFGQSSQSIPEPGCWAVLLVGIGLVRKR